MDRGSKLFADYAAVHRNPVNVSIHWVCVPTIVWSVVGALWCIPFPEIAGVPYVNAATIAIALSLIYFFTLAVLPSLIVTGFLALCAASFAAFERVAPDAILPVSVIVFIVAWIGQFIGHKIEGAKPAFLENFLHLLVGPLWLASKLVGGRSPQEGDAR